MPRKTDFKISLGQRIKYLRNHNLMTQEDLGKKLNVKKTTITNYESGFSEPEGEKLVELASIFDVSVDYLLGNVSVKYPIEELENKLTLRNLSSTQLDNVCNSILHYYSNPDHIIEPLPSSAFNTEKEQLAFQDFFVIAVDYLNCKLDNTSYGLDLFSPHSEEEKKEIQKVLSYMSDKINYIITSLNRKKILWNSSSIEERYGISAVQMLDNYCQLNDLGKKKANENILDLTKIKDYRK